jgi:spore maturation protein SpmA
MATTAMEEVGQRLIEFPLASLVALLGRLVLWIGVMSINQKG